MISIIQFKSLGSVRFLMFSKEDFYHQNYSQIIGNIITIKIAFTC